MRKEVHAHGTQGHQVREAGPQGAHRDHPRRSFQLAVAKRGNSSRTDGGTDGSSSRSPASACSSRRAAGQLRSRPAEFLAELARAQGDAVRFSIGGRPVFLFSHPDDIECVLVERSKLFARQNIISSLRRHRRGLTYPDGLLSDVDEAVHLRARRVLQPAFGRDATRTFSAATTRRGTALAREWRDGATLDVERTMAQLVLEIVSEALFCSPLAPDDARDWCADLRRVMAPYSIVITRTTSVRALAHLRRSLECAAAHERAIERLSALLDAGQTDVDVPGLLAAGYDTRASAVADAFSILAASVETTAAALAWSWHVIGSHPDVERRLHEEIDGVLGDRAATSDDLERLPFTRNVVSEALRLYPPSWFIGRRSLVEQRVGGMLVPEHAMVIVSPYVTQRDSRFFDDPLEFVPDRWTSNTRPAPRYAYFPFGAGARKCIGERLALVELPLLLAALAQKWRLVPTGPAPTALAHATLRPGPVFLMRLAAR